MTIPNQKKDRVWNDPPIPGEANPVENLLFVSETLSPEEAESVKLGITTFRRMSYFFIAEMNAMFAVMIFAFHYFIPDFTINDLIIEYMAVTIMFMILWTVEMYHFKK